MNIMKEEWHKESMPHHVRQIADHYGIFHDMFDGAYFHPVAPLEVAFDYCEESVTPVCYGNIIPAAEVYISFNIYIALSLFVCFVL